MKDNKVINTILRVLAIPFKILFKALKVTVKILRGANTVYRTTKINQAIIRSDMNKFNRFK